MPPRFLPQRFEHNRHMRRVPRCCGIAHRRKQLAHSVHLPRCGCPAHLVTPTHSRTTAGFGGEKMSACLVSLEAVRWESSQRGPGFLGGGTSATGWKLCQNVSASKHHPTNFAIYAAVPEDRGTRQEPSDNFWRVEPKPGNASEAQEQVDRGPNTGLSGRALQPCRSNDGPSIEDVLSHMPAGYLQILIVRLVWRMATSFSVQRHIVTHLYDGQQRNLKSSTVRGYGGSGVCTSIHPSLSTNNLYVQSNVLTTSWVLRLDSMPMLAMWSTEESVHLMDNIGTPNPLEDARNWCGELVSDGACFGYVWGRHQI